MTDDPRDILLSYAARVSTVVLDRLGRDRVESIFVSGGTARGDVAAFRASSLFEIYSDVDLYVIVRGGADLENDRAAARTAAGTVRRNAEGFEIFPEPDIGVFSKEDFLSQRTRPGTVEIAGSHVVLHGDPGIPAEARRFSAADIEPAEGLYLAENRLAELSVLAGRIGHASGDGFRRYLRYVLLKSCLDTGSSVLIALGLFHTSRGERMKRLGDARSREEFRGLMPDETYARIESCYSALTNLQTALERVPAADLQQVVEVSRFLLENWRRVARHISGLVAHDWNALFEWRCKAGRWLDNARELSALARRRSVPRIRVMRHAGSLSRLSPVDAVRLWGAGRMLAGMEADGVVARTNESVTTPHGYLAVLDELTRVFGYTSGDVFERARQMFEETA